MPQMLLCCNPAGHSALVCDFLESFSRASSECRLRQRAPPAARHDAVVCVCGVCVWQGDLYVTKVIPGGPAAFSCEIAVNDVLVAVDGVPVKGETPDEVAKRIVGPEGVPICITVRVRRLMQDSTLDVDKPVTLIRQPAVPMPERLCEGPVGLGIDLVRLENGYFQVRRLQSGGAAQITGKLRMGDILTRINRTDVATLGPRADVSGLVLGDPFSRISLTVCRAAKTLNPKPSNLNPKP